MDFVVDLIGLDWIGLVDLSQLQLTGPPMNGYRSRCLVVRKENREMEKTPIVRN